MGSPADHWPLTTGDDVRDELLRAYGDPARGYHDTRHLTEVLTRLGELADHGTAFDRTPVLLAAWFHDAVYDGERDAEERSATWAEEALPAHADPATVAETARLVRLTETHRPADDDANGCALSDADLGILACPRRPLHRVRRGRAGGVRPPARRGVRQGPPRRADRPARASRGCSTRRTAGRRGRTPHAPTWRPS